MLLLGDCLDVLPHWRDNTFDSVCTDPPYGLDFLNKHWDHNVPGVEYWRQVIRVAKPGAYLTAFGGTRTFHRLVCAIEDAGWEVRDCLMWMYGSGMPKGLDVSKVLDKAAGAERKVIDHVQYRKAPTAHNDYSISMGSRTKEGKLQRESNVTEPATELADIYSGYNVALKPSFEPVVLARKPLVGTVAQNVQQYGTGALNIDAVRVAHANATDLATSLAKNPGRDDTTESNVYGRNRPQQRVNRSGRWPPNVLLGHAADCTDDACCDECPCWQLDDQAPKANAVSNVKGTEPSKPGTLYGGFSGTPAQNRRDDIAGASRFFPRFRYNAKTLPRERAGSTHPTIKPLAVVEWLLRLTAPPGRPVVLDPFAGSGTTLLAARNLGFDAVGIEKEADYVEQAYRRFIA